MGRVRAQEQPQQTPTSEELGAKEKTLRTILNVRVMQEVDSYAASTGAARVMKSEAMAMAYAEAMRVFHRKYDAVRKVEPNMSQDDLLKVGMSAVKLYLADTMPGTDLRGAGRGPGTPTNRATRDSGSSVKSVDSAAPGVPSASVKSADSAAGGLLDIIRQGPPAPAAATEEEAALHYEKKIHSARTKQRMALL
jgi:hypothetical protein